LGSRVRYIWNSEDHVWTEVYSERQERWIHVDSCEKAWDKPLLYGQGWRKKMAYVIGFSVDGAMDVTRRYVRSADNALPRDKISEQELNAVLFRITSLRRATMSAEELTRLQEQDEIEQAELDSYLDEAPTSTSHVEPRESGRGEWTRLRGEDGLQK
jgi:peptide-N4-(N-acetyl-beta-glucosaminyl)asparagine amidase